MPSHTESLAKPNLAFAKIVATPTPTSWSQVYNAGSLFVVVALSLSEANEKHQLPSLGKDIMNNLQSEFFTLEEKTLASIKEVVTKSLAGTPEAVTVSLSLAYCREATLYLVIYGGGRIVMKRQETVGTLLTVKQDTQEPLHGASGTLKSEDLVVLMTPQFLEAISEDDLTSALDVSIPNDVAETLSPKVHGSENGSASALIFSFLGIAPSVFGEEIEPPETESPDQPLPAEEPVSESKPDTQPQIADRNDETQDTPTSHASLLSRFHISRPTLHVALPPLTHTRKLVLTVAVILVIVLGVSIYFTKHKQQEAREKALYQKVYTTAKGKYDEGVGLTSLDKGRAHDDFLAAEKIIKDNINTFPENSTDRQTLSDLLDKVESNLSQTQELHAVTPTQVSTDTDPYLAFVNKQNAISETFDDDNYYYLTSTAVHQVGKSGSADKTIIKNDNDWTNPVSLVAYQGNIYILDQKQGVVKFTAGSDGFGKSSYLKGSQDTTSAVSMAIDGDVWLLFKDGTIKQFTKGRQDNFSISGLDSPLKNPTKIYTTRDLTYLYVLDSGNQRIVKIGKDGTYKAQYQAGILGQAKDFIVSEQNKTIDVLSGGKIWQIAMND